MLPAERRHVGEKLVRNDFAARAQLVDGAAEIDGIPENDGGDGEIEAGSAVALVFEGPVPDFPEAMKEHGARESVARLSFIEAGIGPPPQGGIADPVEREQSALQTADFAKRLGERVLPGIGGKTAQDRRRRYGSGFDRGRQAQDFFPIVGDDALVDRPSNQGIERFVSRARADDIEPTVGEVANARRETESQQMAEAEHVIDRAGGVGVMLADVDRALPRRRRAALARRNHPGRASIRGHGTGFPKSYAKLRRGRAAERRPGATKRQDGHVGLREAALLLFQFLVAMTLVGLDLARQRNVSIEGQVGY